MKRADERGRDFIHRWQSPRKRLQNAAFTEYAAVFPHRPHFLSRRAGWRLLV
jgi:hypothetical protein